MVVNQVFWYKDIQMPILPMPVCRTDAWHTNTCLSHFRNVCISMSLCHECHTHSEHREMHMWGSSLCRGFSSRLHALVDYPVLYVLYTGECYSRGECISPRHIVFVSLFSLWCGATLFLWHGITGALDGTGNHVAPTSAMQPVWALSLAAPIVGERSEDTWQSFF